MRVRAILVWMRLLPMIKMWISASPREPRYCIFHTAWLEKRKLRFMPDKLVACCWKTKHSFSTPGDPPSEAKDRTESSGFHQYGSYPACKRWIILATNTLSLHQHNLLVPIRQCQTTMSFMHQTQFSRIISLPLLTCCS